MRWAWLVTAVLACGCDFNPSDQGTDGPSEDPDGDGVRTVEDNCAESYNPDQHDEDDDAVGDVCDNCPHVANTDQQNAGETNAAAARDGAGDACDPFPTVAGNDIVLFQTFEGGLTGWGQTGNGLWMTSDGALSQGRDDIITTLYVGTPMPGAVVDTTATLISGRGTAAGGFGFGPVALFTPSILHGVGYACDLLDRDGQPFTAAVDYLDSSSFVTLDDTPGGDTSLVGVRVAMRVMAGVTQPAQTCDIAGSSLSLSALANDDRQAEGRVALRTFNAAVRFDHIVVFSLAP